MLQASITTTYGFVASRRAVISTTTATAVAAAAFARFYTFHLLSLTLWRSNDECRVEEENIELK
jgi:hypothetical protein